MAAGSGQRFEIAVTEPIEVRCGPARHGRDPLACAPYCDGAFALDDCTKDRSPLIALTGGKGAAKRWLNQVKELHPLRWHL